MEFVVTHIPIRTPNTIGTMITARKANPEDIDKFKKVVVESVLELCKEHYLRAELKSLLAQYPSRELHEKWIL